MIGGDRKLWISFGGAVGIFPKRQMKIANFQHARNLAGGGDISCALN